MAPASFPKRLGLLAATVLAPLGLGCPPARVPASPRPDSAKVKVADASTELPGDEAPSADVDGTTLFVDESMAECEDGEGRRTCLRVRTTRGAPWTLLYEPIEGFLFEPGVRCELEVTIERAPAPRADAPRLRYRLRRVVAREVVRDPRAPP